MKKTGRRALSALVITAILSLSPFGTVCAAAQEEAIEDCEAVSLAPDVQVASRFLELFLGKKDSKKNGASEELMLCPGGDVFGVKIKEDHVTVIEAKSGCGIQMGDVLFSINGKRVESVEDVKRVIAEHGGGAVKLCVMRDGAMLELEITPVADGDTYKLGLALRDGAAGIGTVTFTDPTTGRFAGLGHGICDAQSGELVEMSSGKVTGVILGGVKKGECGNPGELCGVLTSEERGTLRANTECGVFGTLEHSAGTSECIPVATRDTVHAGDAKIISTVKNGKKAEFAVKIFDVDNSSDGTKSFKIKVTDPVLISLTGGIVRGMSGSPIIQDGKLVGAVTHVMVADPTEGYGIFIENMLNASNARNELPKAA